MLLAALTPTICWRRSGSGSVAISANVPNSAATSARRRRHQGGGALMPGQTDRYFDMRAMRRDRRLVNAKVAELIRFPRSTDTVPEILQQSCRRAFINAEISALLQR